MTTEPLTSHNKPTAGERWWRVWLLLLLAVLAIVAIVAARPWLRPWAVQAMCEVSCTPWAMTVFGWATLAPMPWLFVLLDLAPARRVGRWVVAVACAVIAALACVFLKVGMMGDYRWLGLPEGLAHAFGAGASASMLAWTLFTLVLFVSRIYARRRNPRLDPASLMVGGALVATLVGLAVALSAGM